MHIHMTRLYEASRTLKGQPGPSELARTLNLSRQVLNNWEDRGISKRGLVQIQAELGISASWLEHGQGPRYVGDANVEAVAADKQGRVPLLSFVQAGAWTDTLEPGAFADAQEWVTCPTRHGPRTFALRVRGDSMCNPSGWPSFADGEVIFVDPDREAQHHSLVVVRLDDEQQATFKRLLIDGPAWHLEALNPAWPQRIIRINGNASICGVVIAKVESFI